jgi:hypothetical protein
LNNQQHKNYFQNSVVEMYQSSRTLMNFSTYRIKSIFNPFIKISGVLLGSAPTKWNGA